MATSGSTDFSVNRDTLIGDAMLKIGAKGLDRTPTAAEITHASRQLNMMLKAWMVDGLQIWQRRTKSITLVANQASYTMGPSGGVVMDRPEQILQINRKETSPGTETPLYKISRQEYETLPNKSTTGIPTQFCFHPSITNSTIFIWPVADATTASSYTLEMVYQKPIDDMDDATNDLDMSPEWYEAVVYGLAYRLSFDYGVDVQEQRILYLAAQSMKDTAVDSVVQDSVTFYPESAQWQ